MGTVSLCQSISTCVELSRFSTWHTNLTIFPGSLVTFLGRSAVNLRVPTKSLVFYYVSLYVTERVFFHFQQSFVSILVKFWTGTFRLVEFLPNNENGRKSRISILVKDLMKSGIHVNAYRKTERWSYHLSKQCCHILPVLPHIRLLLLPKHWRLKRKDLVSNMIRRKTLGNQRIFFKDDELYT